MIKYFTIPLKILSVILAGLLVFQAEIMFAQGSDPLQENFQKAKTAFMAGEFQSAQAILDELLNQLATVEGRDPLKGEANLLMGATQEKLQAKEKAIAYYCIAKKLLGEGKSIEGIDLASLAFYKEACPVPPPPAEPPAQTTVVVKEDPYVVQFNEAKTAFFAADYDLSKAILERLISDTAGLPGRDTFKGEIYLLAGATYEHLKYQELSVKYFCLAKQILGKDKSIEGLTLKNYKEYRKECRGTQAAPKKKGGIGKILLPLLGLAILAIAGYFIYTKLIKKDEETPPTPTPIYYETDYQAWTLWSANVTYEYGTAVPTITPDNWGPNPQYSNSYDAQSTVTISGEKILSWKIEIFITACKGLTRQDTIWVNGVEKINVTNRFDRSCTGSLSDFRANPGNYDAKSYLIDSGAGSVSLTLRHKIVFTTPTNATVTVIRDSVFQSYKK